MIHAHRFNCDWFGDSVGILTDPRFFFQKTNQMLEALSAWKWVEFRGARGSVDQHRLRALGFFIADTQVHFRLSLPAVMRSRSLDGLLVRTAERDHFSIDTSWISEFRFERYSLIPGLAPEMVNRRYVLWANELSRSFPATCLQIESTGSPQGWFLSRPVAGKLQLTLAMTALGSCISGQHLYSAAAVTYASQGFFIGEASFSAYNLPVLNIYTSLGARFVKTEDIWFWLNPTLV